MCILFIFGTSCVLLVGVNCTLVSINFIVATVSPNGLADWDTVPRIVYLYANELIHQAVL